VSDLGKKETGLATARPDNGCVGDNKQNMLGHGAAPFLGVAIGRVFQMHSPDRNSVSLPSSIKVSSPLSALNEFVFI
jgi:hypothetical protein